MSNKGLPQNVVKSMLAEEMGDGDGEVEVPMSATKKPSENDDPKPAPQPDVVFPKPSPETGDQPIVERREPTTTPLVPVDMQGLVAALIQGIQGGIAQGAAAARDPIPEQKQHHGKSVYSHPDGDLAHPRTALRCPMYLGIYDEEGKARAAFEIFGDTSTEDDRIILNQLQPGVYPGIRRNDGATASWRVVLHTDDNGGPIRLIIAVPQAWLSKEQQAQMPGQPDFLAQLHAQMKVKAAA